MEPYINDRIKHYGTHEFADIAIKGLQGKQVNSLMPIECSYREAAILANRIMKYLKDGDIESSINRSTMTISIGKANIKIMPTLHLSAEDAKMKTRGYNIFVKPPYNLL